MERLGVAFAGGGMSPGQVVDSVRLAEDLGYESAWVAEGHGGDQLFQHDPEGLTPRWLLSAREVLLTWETAGAAAPLV